MRITYCFNIKFEHILHIAWKSGQHGIEAPVVRKVGHIDPPNSWAL